MLSDAKPTYLEIFKDDLNYIEEIGRGGQGYVYKALWTHDNCKQHVAVKHVFQFDPELSLLQKVKHAHIIQFIGAVNEPHYKAIVIEYAELGSLFDVIRQDPGPNFEQIVLWSKHIATGLDYLHNHIKPRILHRDLKSKNVVLMKNRTAKICDFGSSRENEKTLTHGTLVGTIAWMSPEVMRRGSVNEKIDTYSFGMLLWELITAKIPFDGEENAMIMYGVCYKKRRPPIPASCPDEFRDLITSCWVDEPKERPSVNEILNVLKRMLFNGGLEDQVNSFLEARTDWITEFDAEILAIRDEFKEIEDQYRQQIRKQGERIEVLERERRHRSSTSTPDERGVLGWTREEVVTYISHIHKDFNYEEIFIRNHIDGKGFLSLIETDLERMGITSRGHQKTILNLVGYLAALGKNMTDFPPLQPCKKEAKSPEKCTEFNLDLTYGNNFLIGGKWNLFCFVEANDIAMRSIKHVEYRISSTDIVKCKSDPYVMKNFRSEAPKDLIECKIVFKGNIIKPKIWCKAFRPVLSKGGFSDNCSLTILLNEEVPGSASMSVNSSLSSYIEHWRTDSPCQGAWMNGPPSHYFNNSAPLLPEPPKQVIQAKGNYNRNISSPSKIQHYAKSPVIGRQTRFLTFQEGDLDLPTPTHNPRHPRFSSPRQSYVEEFDPTSGGVFDFTDTLTLNEGFQSVRSSGSTIPAPTIPSMASSPLSDDLTPKLRLDTLTLDTEQPPNPWHNSGNRNLLDSIKSGGSKSFADILTTSEPSKPTVSPVSATVVPKQTTCNSGGRQRKTSTSSNSSQRGGSKRGGRGGRAGSGKRGSGVWKSGRK